MKVDALARYRCNHCGAEFEAMTCLGDFHKYKKYKWRNEAFEVQTGFFGDKRFYVWMTCSKHCAASKAFRIELTKEDFIPLLEADIDG